MELRPIPAFYCVYLLRSRACPSSLYVGSTPNIQRRLSQHNGLAKGGAIRTSPEKLRPWDMTCIVTGFPSNIAALQFEWAWQNPHLTRRIREEERLTIHRTIDKALKKTGKIVQRRARPRMSLANRLANLHLLLRVSSFAKWPLEVRFFYEDVYKKWREQSDAVGTSIPSATNVVLDLKKPLASSELSNAGEPPKGTRAKRNAKKEEIGKGGVDGIAVDYSPLKEHVEKSIFLLAEGEFVNCSVCKGSIKTPGGMTLVCPNGNCRAASHLKCLSTYFLAGGEHGDVVPISGICPRCKEGLRWVDLVKEMTLRTRGERDVAKLMKKPRECKTKIPKGKRAFAQHMVVEEVSDEEADDADAEDEELCASFVVDEPRRDEAALLTEDDDMMSVTSAASDQSQFSRAESPRRPISRRPNLEIVIEDSDWDEAEVLD